MKQLEPMIRAHRDEDDAAILAAFQEATDEGASFPTTGRVTTADARRIWVDDKAVVRVAELEGRFEDSLAEAKRAGFEAMMFNLVFEQNPARRLWEAAGFEVIGRIPRAIDGEQDALIYFREL